MSVIRRRGEMEDKAKTVNIHLEKGQPCQIQFALDLKGLMWTIAWGIVLGLGSMAGAVLLGIGLIELLMR